ncbi:unnamed protein product, partial [Ectocarpus sp. 13 AM-2016]
RPVCATRTESRKARPRVSPLDRSSSPSGPRTTTVPRRWRHSGVRSSSSPAARRSSSPTSGVSPSTPGRYVTSRVARRAGCRRTATPSSTSPSTDLS